MALGVGAGDEVITVPYTWISTAEVISLLGAKPVFVDIRPDTWNMDELYWRLPLPIRPKQLCLYLSTANARIWMPSTRLQKNTTYLLSKMPHKALVLPTKVKNPAIYQPSAAHPFSHPNHSVVMVMEVPYSPTMMNLAEKFRWIRVHGQERKHHHPILGINGRMDTLQAAILLEILEVFPDEVQKRENLGQTYSEGLAHLDGLETPRIGEHNTSVYAQYTILAEQREEIQQSLKEKDIPSVSYYSVPLHLQPVFKILDIKEGDFPVAEKVANQCLSLPMSPYLSTQDQSQVIDAIQSTAGHALMEHIEDRLIERKYMSLQ
jgi:UDP-2-acetamido-2-deoxy-ribo-hexuluronate aminotransferase